MRPTITAKVFGSPDEEQEVRIEIEYYTVAKWFGDRKNYFVNYVKVLDRMNFKPSDIIMDLEQAIAEHFGVRPNEVRIECKVTFSVSKPQLV